MNFIDSHISTLFAELSAHYFSALANFLIDYLLIKSFALLTLLQLSLSNFQNSFEIFIFTRHRNFLERNNLYIIIAIY